MKVSLEGFSVAIPAYSRVKEFEELLRSIYDMSFLPNEIVICEDGSKERKELSAIGSQWKSKFQEKNCNLIFIENEINLGYDANVRKLIEVSSFKWVVLIGNDDLFLKDGLSVLKEFTDRNENISMVSRPFIRFSDDINKPLGFSTIDSKENIYSNSNKSSSKMIFRSCGFVGGLVINRNWALPLATKKYDGSLYYQIYLACNAFCTNGIGYLNRPTVGGRTGNPPLFGSAKSESEIHVPGAYSAKGRAKMWKSVLEISQDIGTKYKVDIYKDLKKELMVKQSFHVFEMNVGVGVRELKELKSELKKIELFNHIVPKFLFTINYFFGRNALIFYRLIRKIAQ
ncbi:glycosyltransferase family A protein [Polaribacter sp. L3A8]|uniref:glycosyltransferase family A protein n=1 Tax=Polaribacter sp. L3A8 TaxID=2686361 RepID=UPI00131B1C77|nr:glycosyltransferase family A protein [Polaribacter sp. L3A8]